MIRVLGRRLAALGRERGRDAWGCAFEPTRRGLPKMGDSTRAEEVRVHDIGKVIGQVQTD